MYGKSVLNFVLAVVIVLVCLDLTEACKKCGMDSCKCSGYGMGHGGMGHGGMGHGGMGHGMGCGLGFGNKHGMSVAPPAISVGPAASLCLPPMMPAPMPMMQAPMMQAPMMPAPMMPAPMMSAPMMPPPIMPAPMPVMQAPMPVMQAPVAMGGGYPNYGCDCGYSMGGSMGGYGSGVGIGMGGGLGLSGGLYAGASYSPYGSYGYAPGYLHRKRMFKPRRLCY